MRFWPFTQKSNTLTDPSPELAALFGAPVGSISKTDAITVPAVSASIRILSEAAASLCVAVVQIGDDGVETEDKSHPVATLLQAGANEWTSTFEFVRDLVAQALIDDVGAVAWVNRVNGVPREIVHYRSGTISVAFDNVTGEPSYRFGDRHLDAADVIHLRSPFSRSPLSLAMSAIETAWHLENHAKTLFRNGARPGGVIEFPKSLGDEGLKKMGAAWRAAHEGSANAGRTAILWDGAKFVPFTLASTDAQFLENRKFQILEIARAFRVPPSMFYELERATWSNSEQMGREFLVYSLEPWLQALEGAMRRALFSPEERSQYRIKFDRDDLTRASLTERATAINSLRASGVINANEGRDWLEMPPRSDAGGSTFENPNITTLKVPA